MALKQSQVLFFSRLSLSRIFRKYFGTGVQLTFSLLHVLSLSYRLMAVTFDITASNVIILGVLIFAVKRLVNTYLKWRVEQMLKKWDNPPKDKVILHTIWRCSTMPSLSPYALKLETYLRMAKIPYELDTTEPIGPKGKIPWITYNDNHMADSHLIMQFLNKQFAINLNEKSTKEQVVIAKTCRIMLEDHFLWGIVQYRWIENFANLYAIFKTPFSSKPFNYLTAYNVTRRMNSLGMGMHSSTEIYRMTEDDLRTVSQILGRNKFLGGNQPCEEDCGVFGMVAQAVWGMPGSCFERLVETELVNLREYCERIKDLYWPDWEDCLDKS